MSIYEYDEERTMRQMREEAFEDGRKDGFEDGQAAGIRSFIEGFLEENFSYERIAKKLEEKFRLSHEKAMEYLAEYDENGKHNDV